MRTAIFWLTTLSSATRTAARVFALASAIVCRVTSGAGARAGAAARVRTERMQSRSCDSRTGVGGGPRGAFELRRDPEGPPLAGPPPAPAPPPKEPRGLLGNRGAGAGPAVLPRRRPVRLRERAEEARLALGRQPDARVLDLEA